MSAFASVEQFRAFTIDDDGLDPLDDAAVERALDRAGRDVERWLGWPAPVTDSPRIDLLTLTAYQAAALARAVCAQSQYRLRLSEEDFAVPEDGIRSIDTGQGGITFAANPPPRFAPVAAEELAGAGLLRRSGTVPPDIAA